MNQNIFITHAIPLKRWFLVSILCLIGIQTISAMSSPPRYPDITIRGNLNTSCISSRGGTAYLQIEITTGGPIFRDKRPMNIALVLDRSGSMGDERKMDYAKKAVLGLIDRLSSEDYLSIVIYDDQVETLVPPRRLTDKRQIKRLIDEIYPRGSTNLGGGMQEGFRQIERNFKREYINRVILLSDGLANQGITDPYDLNRIASRYRNQSISLTTMGVGLDYNENLMLGLAEHGGGNYYFIESPYQLASIFERELQGLASVVAQNAYIELNLGRGVKFNNAIGCGSTRNGDRWVLSVGDLYANEHREFTIELNIPEGSGTKHVATGILKYDRDREWTKSFPKFSVDIRYSDVTAELEKSRDWDTQAKVDVAISTSKVEKALGALDAGNREEAEKEINEAKLFLQSSPAMTNSSAGAGLMQEQVKQLESFSRDVKDDSIDARKVKKSMQYQNYSTQKKRK